MYVSTAWSRVYALDAVTGRQLWRYDPKIPGRIGFDACCDVVTRGVAVADGRVFLAALDGRLIALDAKTGKRLWSVADDRSGQALYDHRRAARRKGQGDHRQRRRRLWRARLCDRLFTATGKQAWRFYTVPGDPNAAPDGAASDAVLKKAALSDWAGRWYDMAAAARCGTRSSTTRS